MASPATRSHPSSSRPSASDTAGTEAIPVLAEAPGATGSLRTLDGKDLRIAIVFSRWYGKQVVHPLVDACKNELLAKGVSAANVIRVEVSGAFEIPFAASRLIETKREKLDAVICIGCMVKGATMAYEFVSEAVAMAIMKLNVMTDTPVIFGVLTCASEDQAKQCAADIGGCRMGVSASSKQCSHGVEWAQSALEMAHLKRSTAEKIASKRREYASCVGGKQQQQQTDAAMTKSSAAGATCTGCSKASDNCSCQNCTCNACGLRAAKAEALP